MSTCLKSMQYCPGHSCFPPWHVCWLAATPLQTLSKCMQAYGDAVMDEVPIFAISNHETAIFLKRSQHVGSKVLECSPVIFRDGRNGLPMRVAWLWCLEEAVRLQGWKAGLQRKLVPKTGPGLPF